MKFRKKFSKSTDEILPDWRDKYLDYKDLKKRLKLICPDKDVETKKRPRVDLEATVCGDCKDETAKKVSAFEEKLEAEVYKFNWFIMENEEEYIIKWEVLKEIAGKAEDVEELMKICREVVDFHGEMVLLQSYSALNYIGLVKILKKYKKRSGAVTRSPIFRMLVQQPFFSTEVLNRLVNECERTLDCLFFGNEQLLHNNDSRNENGQEPRRLPEELGELEHME
ncbi:hypothetical protein CRG98_031180, partial [Punica granatum]